MLTVLDNRASWAVVAPGFDVATFPLLPDDGDVFKLYSATYYDTYLIDKDGKLAATYRDFVGSELVETLKRRIRELGAE